MGTFDNFFAYSLAGGTATSPTQPTDPGTDPGTGTTTASVPTQGLVAYWKMDEESGDRINSVSDRHLQEVNGTVLSTAGKVGNCAIFNAISGQGSPGLQTAGVDTILSSGLTDPFSICCWTWFDNNTNFYNVLSQSDSTNSEESISLFLPTSSSGSPPDTDFSPGKLALLVSSNGQGSGRLVLEAQSTTALNIWIFISIVYDGANLSLYINTELQESKPVSQIYRSNITPFAVGGLPNNPRLQGRVEELGIWNLAFTSTEIAQIYNNGNGSTYVA